MKCKVVFKYLSLFIFDVKIEILLSSFLLSVFRRIEEFVGVNVRRVMGDRLFRRSVRI